MYVSDKIEIRETKNGKSVIAVAQIFRGEIMFEFEKNFLKYPTKTSMQIDDEIHQEAVSSNAAENFLNHSCDPNGYVDFSDLTYRAVRQIMSGEELTFNYLTTEWDLVNEFDCRCNDLRCYGTIKGFRYLTHEQQKDLLPLISPYLKRKFKEIETESENN